MESSSPHSIPESLQPILNLAKARELLLLEAQDLMPRGGREQRDQIIRTYEAQINNALANTVERFGAMPEVLDEVSQKAWTFLEHAQKDAKQIFAGSSAYENLKRVFAQASDFFIADEMLEWITSTHLLPAATDSSLEDAKAATALFKHHCLAQPIVQHWIEQVNGEVGSLSKDDARNFTLMKMQWQEAAGLDANLVEALSRACTQSNKVWEECKSKGDFATWLPYFEEVVRLTRAKGEALGKVTGDSPYQALLNSFNPELRNEKVNEIFDEMGKKLPKLIADVSAKQAQEPPPIELPPVAIEKQEAFAQHIMHKLGLTDDHARLDTSAHPFSCGQWDDVRITSRYREDNISIALWGVIHEAGHALYSSSLPKEWKGQPIGDTQSMWVHETQSLFWEQQIAGSKEFMEFLSGELKKELGVEGPAWSPENLHKLITRSRPSLIRVDADEVTYPAHVILRHNIEQKLIDGSLAPKDVPAAWEKGLKALLPGVEEIPDHGKGCMQDVHWPEGMIGYFPAYTFGAIGAAQLMEKLKEDMPDVGEHIKKGDFAPVRNWLKMNVHEQGSRYSGEDLFEKVTGKPLSPDAWFHHIEERYLGPDVAKGKNWQAAAQQGRGVSGAERVGP